MIMGSSKDRILRMRNIQSELIQEGMRDIYAENGIQESETECHEHSGPEDASSSVEGNYWGVEGEGARSFKDCEVVISSIHACLHFRQSLIW